MVDGIIAVSVTASLLITRGQRPVVEPTSDAAHPNEPAPAGTVVGS